MSQLSKGAEGTGEVSVIQQLMMDAVRLIDNIRLSWKRIMDARIPESDVIQDVQAQYVEMSKKISLSGSSTCNGLLGSDGKKLLESIFIERTSEFIIIGPNEEGEVVSKKNRIIYEVALIEKILKEWIPLLKQRNSNNNTLEIVGDSIFTKDIFTSAHISLLQVLGIKMEIVLSENKERQIQLSLIA